MNAKTYIPLLGAALACLTGCMTQSRVIPTGATAEVVAGFSQDDIDATIKQAIQNIDASSARYHQGAGRRVINVKPFVVDTLSRGNAAEPLAESLTLALKEKLMNHGSFIVYNEQMANAVAATGQMAVPPEFLLVGHLTQRNMRKDNGDIYQEFSLNLTMTCSPYHPNAQLRGLDIWQRRIPLRKEVDRANAMN